VTAALKELARVLRPEARLVVSDPHGRAAYVGGQGFYGSGGVTRANFIRNHYRQAAEWIEGFSASSFDIASCVEPRLTPRLVAEHPVAAYFPEAVAVAFGDSPFLWVWSVVRNYG
jgi:hypothetical protein